MTDNEANIAVAEACGWKRSRGVYPHSVCDWIRPDGAPAADVPDYGRDLNAMHEAEKMLIPKGGLVFHDYTVHLLEICEKARNHTYCATAAQRREAFLRTIGKWKD